MIDLEEGKRLLHAVDTANLAEYSRATRDWQSWAIAHARDLIDAVEKLRAERIVERDDALAEIELLKLRLNSPCIWPEADEAAFQELMKRDDFDWLFEDDYDPELDDPK